MKNHLVILALLTIFAPDSLVAQRPPGPPSPPPPPGERGGESRSSYSSSSSQSRVMRSDSRGRTARPVVVSSQTLDAKELAVIEEDLGIMARLLEKEIEREVGADGLPNAMGIALTRLDGRGPSVTLLEGYGAVFNFTVRLPLTPPPARGVEKKQERSTDSPWERTRRELFGAGDEPGGRGGPSGRFESTAGGGVSFGGGGGFGDGWPGRISPPEQYDAKKVEGLKKAILESLKQAGNIRALKAEDYLTVVVQGGGNGAGHMEFSVETRTTTSSGGGAPRTEVNRSSGGEGPRSGVLTIRAKKSDAVDYAQGKLTTEQFAKKALVMIR